VEALPELRSMSRWRCHGKLVAIWWQSLGARMWGVRRRNTQPRLMIDIALAEESPISTLAMTEIVRDRETA